MYLKGVEWEGEDWTNLAQDRDNWEAVVNAIEKFGFYELRGISVLAEKLLVFMDDRCVGFVIWF